MIGRTHGMHAEPTTFGLKLAVWYDELRRQQRRLMLAREDIAVGKISGRSGRTPMCRLIWRRRSAARSAWASLRRRLRSSSAIGMHSSWPSSPASAERWRRWRPRFAICSGPKSGKWKSRSTRGTRVPRPCHTSATRTLPSGLAGLARLLRGYATTAAENNALWHERDISHSSTERVIMPDAFIVLDFMLHEMTDILDRLVVHPDRMLENLELTRGLIYSQPVLLALVDAGMDRQEAYKLVQGHAQQSLAGGPMFESASDRPGGRCLALAGRARRRCSIRAAAPARRRSLCASWPGWDARICAEQRQAAHCDLKYDISHKINNQPSFDATPAQS